MSTPSSYLSTAAVPLTGSFQSRTAAMVTRASVRRLNNALPSNAAGVWFGRKMVATFMAALGPPLPGTTVVPVRDAVVRGEWVSAPGVTRADKAIYYIHGSGYVVCSARTHRGLASRLSKTTGVPVFLTDYRLAPEHCFPAAADDVEAGYRWLQERGFRPQDIVVAGDSAGGHLAMDLLIENARQGQAQPAGAVMFSPLVDLTLNRARAQEAVRKDPMISAQAARRMVEMYSCNEPEDHPRLGLSLRTGVSLPPILVQAGGAEMLKADAEYLYAMVTAAGGRCELEVWPDQMHVFQALPLIIPEAAGALRRAAAFIQAAHGMAVGEYAEVS